MPFTPGLGLDWSEGDNCNNYYKVKLYCSINTELMDKPLPQFESLKILIRIILIGLEWKMVT